jgi:adenosylmethionine-8-amino-7-oxononanoate aminotransferase
MNDLTLLDKKNIWHPFTPLVDPTEQILIESAKGIYLHTADGRKIMDAISSWWVNLHGHSHPVIAQAIANQAAKLEHVIFAGFTHEPAITLSKNLLKILPANFSKIFFSDNGSTAVEVAIKMGIQYWHNQGIAKNKIIALSGAYLGDTFGSMSAGDRGIFSKPFEPYLFVVEFIDFPTTENEEEVYSQFVELVDKNEVGIFIYEPLVQGASGMRMYSAQILDRLIEYAHNKNVICIADEVFTGFGRTGKLFASDYLKNKPDLISLSKGLTGGAIPLGVTVASEKIIKEFQSSNFLKTFFHGHSFTANPISCAAANASFELLMHPACQLAIKLISEQQQNFLHKIKNERMVKEARCLGTIIAIELNTPEESSYTNDIRKIIYNHFLSKEILLRPLGNVFYIVPPYCITSEELYKIHTHIFEFLSTLE